VTDVAPEMERTALNVVLTGSFAGTPELVHGLDAADSGFNVTGRAAAIENAAAQLQDPSVTAVLHCVTRESAGSHGQTSLGPIVRAIRSYTLAPVIVLAAEAEPGLVEEALEAGVDDVLVLPQPLETVAFAIRKASRNAERAYANGKPRGQVITVFSPKGGTGKTVLATNLGALLAAKSSKRVLLIDLDLQFGDAAIMLGVDPKRTMHELVQSPGELDAGKLAAFTTRHRSGLDVLAAPLLPEQAELVTETKVLGLIEVAREAYDLIVIDTSPFFYGPMLALLGPTDHLLLLCGLDVPTLKNVRLSLRTLELLGFPAARTNLVLNRVAANVGLTTQDVAEALGTDVRFEIPNDAVVAPAVNRGAAPVLHEPDSEFARALTLIAGTLQPTIAAPSARNMMSERTAPRLRRLVPRRVLEGRV